MGGCVVGGVGGVGCTGGISPGRTGGVTGGITGGTASIVERRYQFSPAPRASAAWRLYSKAPASTCPPASAKALLVVCAVVVAPLRALITSMPLPVVIAPSPPRVAIWTLVVPLAAAEAPSSTSLSLPDDPVPSRRMPAF